MGLPIRRGLEVLRDDGVRPFFARTTAHIFGDVALFRADTLRHTLAVGNYAATAPDQRIHVPLVRLTESSQGDDVAFDPTEYRGAIVAGRWDRHGTQFAGTKWMRDVEQLDEVPTAEQLRTHFRTVGRDTMERARFDRWFGSEVPSVEEHPPSVNITRDGTIQVNSGHRQIAMAHIRGLEQIPVRVSARHVRWQHFRNQIKYYNRRYLDAGVAYNQIPHPDYSTTARHDSQRRFELMAETLQRHEGTVLDIGSHMDGYFCHRFEELGFDCYAVENSAIRAWFLRKFKQVNDKSFTVIKEDITESSILDNRFTICLALNVFHHFLKSETGYNALLDVLNRLDAEVMFLQAHTESYVESYRSRGENWYRAVFNR